LGKKEKGQVIHVFRRPHREVPNDVKYLDAMNT